MKWVFVNAPGRRKSEHMEAIKTYILSNIYIKIISLLIFNGKTVQRGIPYEAYFSISYRVRMIYNFLHFLFDHIFFRGKRQNHMEREQIEIICSLESAMVKAVKLNEP